MSNRNAYTLDKQLLCFNGGRCSAPCHSAVFCVYKAANAGRTVLFVNPKYTSQICSGCGAVAKKELGERWHSCSCGCELDRDMNAAINILRLGRSHQAQA